jgi:hypothetical protein
MRSKWMGPDALAGAHGAAIWFYDSDDTKSNPPRHQSQQRCVGALAAAVADPIFRHKVFRALRSARLRLDFAAEVVALFGREPIKAALDRVRGISDEALILNGGDRVPLSPSHEVAS